MHSHMYHVGYNVGRRSREGEGIPPGANPDAYGSGTPLAQRLSAVSAVVRHLHLQRLCRGLAGGRCRWVAVGTKTNRVRVRLRLELEYSGLRIVREIMQLSVVKVERFQGRHRVEKRSRTNRMNVPAMGLRTGYL